MTLKLGTSKKNKIRNFCYSQDAVKRMKREVMNQGTMSAAHIRVNAQNV